MSDYPLCFQDDSHKFVIPAAPVRASARLAAMGEDQSEDHFDWDSAALVAPGGLTPARQLAMQRQQERLSSTAPRKPEEAVG